MGLRKHRLTRGLVGLWLTDDNDPAVAYDHSGNLNHGAIYGASWTQGRVGRGLSFDGVDDYIDCGTGNTLNNIIKGITIAAWFYKVSYSYGTIASKYSHYEIHLDPSNCFVFQTNNSSGDVRARTNFQLDLNKWYFGVFTYDYYNTPHHKLYVNGVNSQLVWLNSDDDGNQADGGLWPVPLRPFRIGTRPDGSLKYYGYIDEVVIWNRALSEDEIKDLYAIGRIRNAI